MQPTEDRNSNRKTNPAKTFVILLVFMALQIIPQVLICQQISLTAGISYYNIIIISEFIIDQFSNNSIVITHRPVVII